MENSQHGPLVELPAFQGPLDLLLQLIQAEKVDIYDIPISRIAEQFIQAVEAMESLDMEVTSEFLVLAAQLLYIKSRYLLPKLLKAEAETEETDPRRELVERLVAYKAYRQAAQWLGGLEENSGQRFFREEDIETLLGNVQTVSPLEGVCFADLWQAFRTVLTRVEKGEEVHLLKPEEIGLEVMLKDVWRRVLLHPEGIGLHLLLRTRSRLEMVVAFLALLELLKDGRIRTEQSSARSEIFLFPTSKAWEFIEEE